MNRCIGCETARELLDQFLDGELTVEEQVMVESHLRWCQTCACRVEDMRLIGSSLRDGAYGAQAAETDLDAVNLIRSGVLLRVSAEQEQSFAFRIRDMFSDMRLFWPLLGATTALAVCVTGAFLVLHWSTEERPESLAAMISTLSQPGSEDNPLLPNSGVRSVDNGLDRYVDENRLSAGISIPRALDDGALIEDVQRAVLREGAGDDAMLALQTVVTRDGRVANYRVLSEGGRGQGARRPDHLDAVLADAVRQSRFVPAQTPGGSKVAVNMIWVFFSTTAVMPTPDAIVRARRVQPPPPPARPATPETEGDRPSSTLPASAAA